MADRILVVEDEVEIAKAIEVYLKTQQYEVVKASNGQEALELFEKESFDLILMDLMMPIMDGVQTTLKIREKSIVPIIMLTAKSEDTDKIWGLNIGADDYVTKPFNPMELLARVNSALRRSKDYAKRVEENTDEIVIGGIKLNKMSNQVYVEEVAVRLTPTEYGILYLLMSHPNQVFSIEQIYEKVWNEVAYSGAETVTVHIRRIREKIEINPKEPKYLKVVWGIGYKFEK
ncbi:MAG: response regulator transcription factor [Cellulosilyticum sp.]|nr:response regulator transcription factor [Cellulosilyticum sp.]